MLIGNKLDAANLMWSAALKFRCILAETNDDRIGLARVDDKL